MKIKLGNLVEFFTTYTGMKFIWKKIKKGDCSGCQRRKEKLNNLFEK